MHLPYISGMSLSDMADCILTVYDYGEMFDCILPVYEHGRHGWLCTYHILAIWVFRKWLNVHGWFKALKATYKGTSFENFGKIRLWLMVPIVPGTQN